MEFLRFLGGQFAVCRFADDLNSVGKSDDGGNASPNNGVVIGDQDFSYASALNDMSGLWKIEVTHVNTGRKRVHEFEMSLQ